MFPIDGNVQPGKRGTVLENARKTKAQLIAELAELRFQNAMLQESQAGLAESTRTPYLRELEVKNRVLDFLLTIPKVSSVQCLPRVDRVVPFAMKMVRLQIYTLHLFVRYLASRWVFAPVQSADRFQALGGRCSGD